MNKVTTSQLMKIASVGGVFVIGNVLLMRFLIQKRLKQSPYFVQARDVVMGNRALVNFLGEPIGFGSVDFGNSANYSTTQEAKFAIPLKGSSQEGMLYLWSIRTEEQTNSNLITDEHQNKNSDKYSGWNLKNLEVTIKDKPNQKLILVEDFALSKPKGRM